MSNKQPSYKLGMAFNPIAQPVELVKLCDYLAESNPEGREYFTV